MGDDEVKPLPDGVTHYDSQGQPNGPTDAEQASADAEQLELVNAIKAQNAIDEHERQKLLNDKIQRAMDADAERRSIDARLKLVEARLTVLEAK